MGVDLHESLVLQSQGSPALCCLAETGTLQPPNFKVLVSVPPTPAEMQGPELFYVLFYYCQNIASKQQTLEFPSQVSLFSNYFS